MFLFCSSFFVLHFLYLSLFVMAQFTCLEYIVMHAKGLSLSLSYPFISPGKILTLLICTANTKKNVSIEIRLKVIIIMYSMQLDCLNFAV